MAALTMLFIPAKILSYGYLPGDDALRHAAKVVSGKPWSEILVMRSDFALDPHPGWHAVLGWIYHGLNCSTEALVLIPSAGLMLLVSASVLLWLRWPEAWLAALLVAAIATPFTIKLLMLGRPYLVTMVVFITLLLVWSRMESRRPRLNELVLTILLMALAAWIHGTFYQLILPAAGLVLAGRWRQGVWFGGCWAAGSFLGSSFTGHPWQFLEQSVRHLLAVFGTHRLMRQLVVELHPSDGDCIMVLAVAGMLLWRARSPGWKARDLVEPIFLMGVVGWILGLATARFWLDWGLPATLLWLALSFQQQFQSRVPFESGLRMLLTAGLALGLYLAATSDRDSRWTRNLNKEYLNADDPALAGWLPGNGGILYSADMDVFFETFFKNPKAPWRYILGFEPGLMRPEDLDVVDKVIWNNGDVRGYKAWVDKMRPEDRLVIPSSWLQTIGAPGIPELEWRYVAKGLWLGRLRPPDHAPPPQRQ